jgi:hypothetical protein
MTTVATSPNESVSIERVGDRVRLRVEKEVARMEIELTDLQMRALLARGAELVSLKRAGDTQGGESEWRDPEIM